jgi:amino acid transporter
VGVLGLAASIVNITIGGGIFRLPSMVAATLHAAAPIAFVLCAAVMGVIVVCFAEAGKRVDLTGGPYAWVGEAFGPFPGFLAGVLLWLPGTLAMSAVATILADAFAGLVKGVTLPVLAGPAGRPLFLVALFGVLGAINVSGVRQGTWLNVAATAAKLVPLAGLVVVGLFAIDPANLLPSAAPSAATLSRAAMLLMFAFFGLESALIPSGEIEDVRRTVPRAILVAMVAVTLLYVAVQVVAQGVLGEALASETAPLAAAAAKVFGPRGAVALYAGTFVAMLGSVAGMTLAAPRGLYAFAARGVLPRALLRVHPRFRTPSIAIAVQCALVCLLAVTSGFERLAVIANLSALLLYALCCLAAWRLSCRERPAWRAAWAPLLACGAILWLLTSITWPEWRVLGAVLLPVSLLYALKVKWRSDGGTA